MRGPSPASYHGTHDWPSMHGGVGSSRAQNELQQPDEAQPGTNSLGRQYAPGSQTSMYSHGSPGRPASPEWSSVHTKESSYGTQISPSLQSCANGSHPGKQISNTPSLEMLHAAVGSSHVGLF